MGSNGARVGRQGHGRGGVVNAGSLVSDFIYIFIYWGRDMKKAEDHYPKQLGWSKEAFTMCKQYKRLPGARTK